jgi:ATP phosphoribosyltransferase regulatory subunit
LQNNIKHVKFTLLLYLAKAFIHKKEWHMIGLKQTVLIEKKNLAVKQMLMRLFEQASFLFVEPSLFVPTSTFIKKHPSFNPSEIIQTSLRDGLMYAVRPDITTALMQQWLPIIANNEQLRVYYMSNHYRQDQHGVVVTNECGFEVYGTFALADQLSMIETILKTCHQPVTLVIGFPSLMNRLLNQVVLNENTSALRYAIKTKSLKEISLNVDETMSKKLAKYIQVYDALASIKDLVDSTTYATLASVQQACPNLTIKYDLSLLPEFDYYSGIYIKGYMQGYETPILFGGSYDDRTNHYGQAMQAFGVSINMDMLYQEVIQ